MKKINSLFFIAILNSREIFAEVDRDSGAYLLMGFESCDKIVKDEVDWVRCGLSMGYVQGFVHSVELAPKNQICISYDKFDRVIDVVQRQLLNNKEDLFLPKALHVSKALLDAYPCTKTKAK